MNAKLLSVSNSSRMLPESWEFKISKKVAQLTKVIYTLNSRNEDNEERVKWLVQNHQDELRRLRQEYTEQIERAVAKVKHIENKQTELLGIMEKDCQSVVTEVRNTFSDRLHRISTALEVAKKSFEDKLARFEQENSVVLQEELSKLRKSKDLEVANLVKEYNDRYKTMLAEQMDIRDRIEKDIRTECKLQVSTLEEKLSIAKTKFNEQLDFQINKMRSEVAKRTALEKELITTKEYLRQMETNQQQLRSSNEELHQQLNKMHQSLDLSKSCEEGIKKQLKDIAKDKLEAAEELKVMHRTLQEAQNRAELLATDYARIEKELRGLIEEKLRAQENCSSLHKQHEELQCVTQKMKEECTWLTQSVQDKDSEIAQLKSALQKYMEEAETLKFRNAHTIRALKEAQEEELRRMEQHSQESVMTMMAQCEQKMDEMRMDFDKRRQDDVDAQQKRNALLIQEKNRLYENLENKILAIQEEKNALNEQKIFLQQERDAIQEKYNLLESEHRLYKEETSEHHIKDAAKVAQLQEEILSLRQKTSEMDSLESVLNEQRVQFTHDQETLLSRLEAEKHQIQEDCDRRLREEREQYLRYVAGLKESRESVEHRLTLLTEENTREMQKLRTEANEALKRVVAEAESTQNRLSDKIKCLESELELHRSSGERDKLQARDEAKRLHDTISELRAMLVENEAKHTEALKELREFTTVEHAAEIGKERQSHAREMERMREEMTTRVAEHKKLLCQLEHASIQREQEKEQAWCARMNAIQKQGAEERQRLARDHAIELENQLNELGCAKDKTISMYQEELLCSTKKVQAAMEEVEHLQRKLYQSEKALANLSALIEQERCGAAEALAQLRHEHQEAMQRVEDMHKKELERLIGEHKRISNETFLSFEEERRSHRLLVEQMKASYEELQHKYHYRESRTEDVDMINELRRTICEKDKLIKKVQHDLQTYKLELINREENYNKLFGKKPVVAADRTTQQTATNLPLIKTTAHKGTPRML